MKTSHFSPFEQFQRFHSPEISQQTPNRRFWLLHFDRVTEISVKSGEADAMEQPDSVLETENSIRSAAMANLEAVLFVAREPMSARRIAQLADFSENINVRSLLKELNEQYDKQKSAFRVIEVAGGFQLRTRPEFAPWLVRMQEVPSTVRLSAPTMETLAVVAYRQPVLRAEIERLRGVQCGELIRQLLDCDLVRIVGRSEELGRPFYYGTTKNFLQVFGLGSLHDLPDRDQFSIESDVLLDEDFSETDFES